MINTTKQARNPTGTAPIVPPENLLKLVIFEQVEALSWEQVELAVEEIKANTRRKTANPSLPYLIELANKNALLVELRDEKLVFNQRNHKN